MNSSRETPLTIHPPALRPAAPSEGVTQKSDVPGLPLRPATQQLVELWAATSSSPRKEDALFLRVLWGLSGLVKGTVCSVSGLSEALSPQSHRH